MSIKIVPCILSYVYMYYSFAILFHCIFSDDVEYLTNNTKYSLLNPGEGLC